MNVVWVVSHQRPIEHWRSGFVDTKHIGVFTTLEQAGAAIEVLTQQPGFRQHPSGFSVRRVVIDSDEI